MKLADKVVWAIIIPGAIWFFSIVIRILITDNPPWDEFGLYILFTIVLISLIKPLNLLFYPESREKYAAEKSEKKLQKQIKKERYVTTKCSWCNQTFTPAESGYRFHCSRRCNSEDS